MLHQLAEVKDLARLQEPVSARWKRLFIKTDGVRPHFLMISNGNKGLDILSNMPKESLAQQGGFALTNKVLAMMTAWLIFMDIGQ